MREPFTVGPDRYAAWPSGVPGRLRALAAFNRINALACIKSAERGWLGGCFSCAELLTALYFGAGERNVVLSKGHASAMQYACLHGLGLIDRRMLLSYKDGPGALQAHTDRTTPGILVSTGSLGQAPSTVAGLALCRPDERFAVVLGDGELQEGQVFEACQTVAHRRLANLTLVVDRNGFQSTRPVAEVKGVADYRRLFEGLGLAVLEVDGHDPDAVLEAWRAAAGAPTVVVAHTQKAGGSRLLPPEGGRQPWHARVPDDGLYRRLVSEQVELGDDWLRRAFAAYASSSSAESSPTPSPSPSPAPAPSPSPSPSPSPVQSTREAYAATLGALLRERPDLWVLDADLAHSCGIEPLEGHERFLELGIAEQDMVSLALGLALEGRLPVVNTYAAFFKRALEQVHVNAASGAKMVYAGGYGGLCYHTDGVTHQSLTDLSMMLTVPGLQVMDPATAEQAQAFLRWAVDAGQRAPVYLRLRRTPLALDLPAQPLDVARPLTAGHDFTRCFVTAGTVPTRLAQDCRRDPAFSGWGLLVQGVLRGPLDRVFWRERLAGVRSVVTIEDDAGALRAFVLDLLASLGLAPEVRSLRIERFGASFRTLPACLEHFGFTVERVRELAATLRI